MKTEVLGVRFDNMTRQEAAQRGAQLLDEDRYHYVVTPNPEIILDSEKDPPFRAAINGADLVLPDGIGVIYAARILGTPIRERLPGIEFATDMLRCLNLRQGRLFLLGAKPHIAEEAGQALCARYPRMVLCGTHDGYFQDEQALLEEVCAARPDLIFVCLGAPKQELWMAKYGPRTGARMAIGLGGALDVFSGHTLRAPESWRRLGLEWAYRLKCEPWRFRRMARLPLVLVKAAKERITPGKGENSRGR